MLLVTSEILICYYYFVYFFIQNILCIPCHFFFDSWFICIFSNFQVFSTFKDFFYWFIVVVRERTLYAFILEIHGILFYRSTYRSLLAFHVQLKSMFSFFVVIVCFCRWSLALLPGSGVQVAWSWPFTIYILYVTGIWGTDYFTTQVISTIPDSFSIYSFIPPSTFK